MAEREAKAAVPQEAHSITRQDRQLLSTVPSRTTSQQAGLEARAAPAAESAPPVTREIRGRRVEGRFMGAGAK
jgi:hypothetical protein